MTFTANDIDTKVRLGDSDFAIWLEKNLDIIKSLLAETPWVVPTLLNSWADVAGSGDELTAYRRVGLSILELRGFIDTGTETNGTVLFTLPLGFRPTNIARVGGLLAEASGENAYSIRLLQNGNVTIYGVSGGSALLSLHTQINLDN